MAASKGRIDCEAQSIRSSDPDTTVTSAVVAAQPDPQDSTHEMQEVVVKGQRPDVPHPQDGNYSERPLGCVEVVTPSSTGNELGGYFLARNAPSGVAVMPSLNDPRSANETYQRGTELNQYQAARAGESIPNPCVN